MGAQEHPVEISQTVPLPPVGTGRVTRETPHRCPVCGGAGSVFESLYTRLPTTTVTGCRSCYGTGVLWR